MPPIRIGFVGAGFIAGVHAEILGRDPRARISAVVDPDERRAALLALKHDARALPSVDDVIAQCDAIYICHPNALHADVAVRALDAGIHVFSEKPMATSVDDAARVLDASRRARGVYQVGFNRRFASVYRALKARLDAGDILPLSAALKMNRGELQRPAWTADTTLSGGFLHETPVHMLDLVRHLIGDPVEVVCRARSCVYGELDNFSMLLSFASGASATLTTCAHATWLSPFERIEIYGDHATTATEEMERITFSTSVAGRVEVMDFAQQPLEERWGYAEADRRFLDAVLGEGEVAVTAADGLATTALVDRCYRAAAEPAQPG